MTMEKTLTQLAEETKTLETKEDRLNFICRNIFDLLDISTATDKELVKLAKEVGTDAG